MTRGGALFLVFSVVISAAVGYLVDRAVAPAGSTSAPSVRAVALVGVPTGSDDLEVIGGQLELLGCDSSSGVVWRIDPATLTLRPTAACSGQFPPGRQVSYVSGPAAGPISRYWDCNPETGLVRAAIRRGGHVIDGPVVMRYAGSCSTTRPIAAYTGNSLWIYDSATGPTGRTGQMLELSASTGAVEQSVTMASDPWTSFAVDPDGAFVASYDNTGPIYFVANNAGHAVVALRTGGRVNWFDTDGSTVYANVGPPGTTSCAPSACGIWRFSGSSGTSALLSRNDQVDSLLSTATAGDGGLFCIVSGPDVDYSGPDSDELVWIDGTSGRWHVLARVDYGSWAPSLAYFDGELFVVAQSGLYRYSLS